MMKILSLFVLSISMAGFALASLSETATLTMPAAKPYESNFYVDHVGPTPTKIAHAFLLGLLYDAPPISR